MTRLADALVLYRRLVAASLRSQMQYRAAVMMGTIGALLITGSEFVALWALFDRFGHLGGWRLPEVALFYGMISVTYALCDAISDGFDKFGRIVKSGDFDRVLLRPRSTVLQLLGHDLTLRRVGRFAQGAVVLGYAFRAGHIAWTLGHALLFITAIACGICVFLGILILHATSAFWTVETLEVWNAFTYGGVTMSQYPLAIYRDWFRALFTYVFPVGCVVYLPGLVILGREDALGAPPLAGWLAPLAGPVFLASCLGVWRFGVRHYRSTGS